VKLLNKDVNVNLEMMERTVLMIKEIIFKCFEDMSKVQQRF